MTNNSDRSLQLAAQLRQQALQNLEQTKRAECDRSRSRATDRCRQTREN